MLNLIIIHEMRRARYASSVFRFEKRETDIAMEPAQAIIYMAPCAIHYDSDPESKVCLDTLPLGHYEPTTLPDRQTGSNA